MSYNYVYMYPAVSELNALLLHSTLASFLIIYTVLRPTSAGRCHEKGEGRGGEGSGRST